MIHKYRYLMRVAGIAASPIVALADQTPVHSGFLAPMATIMRTAVTPASYAAAYNAVRAHTLQSNWLVQHPVMQRFAADHFGKLTGVAGGFMAAVCTWACWRLNWWRKDRIFDQQYKADEKFRKKAMRRAFQAITLEMVSTNGVCPISDQSRFNPVGELVVSEVNTEYATITYKDLINNKTWQTRLQSCDDPRRLFTPTTERSRTIPDDFPYTGGRAASSTDSTDAAESSRSLTHFSCSSNPINQMSPQDQLENQIYGWSAMKGIMRDWICATWVSNPNMLVATSKLVEYINITQAGPNDFVLTDDNYRYFARILEFIKDGRTTIVVDPNVFENSSQTQQDLFAQLLEKFDPRQRLGTTRDLLALEARNLVGYGKFKLSGDCVPKDEYHKYPYIKFSMQQEIPQTTDGRCIQFTDQPCAAITVWNVTKRQFEELWPEIREHIERKTKEITFTGYRLSKGAPKPNTGPVTVNVENVGQLLED